MKQPIGLFEAFGIEIELMIVDTKTLSVKPCADQLLSAAANASANNQMFAMQTETRFADGTQATAPIVSDFEDGDITWSNELVAHVIEFKTTGPAPSLETLESSFYESQQHAQRVLKAKGLRLMPTGMHPWMNPEAETVLWPHDNNDIYSLYDKIFDCRGHGWSNLQSVHINLPFASEAEFKRLHSAVRILLAIIPALGASTPICDGEVTGLACTRLAHYETNQKAVPIIAGDIIPEAVTGYSDYREQISNPIQAAIRSYDPENLLEGDWLNSRGAIARIDRGSIEIRLLDTQECAHADITLVRLIVETIRSIIEDKSFLADADALDSKRLRKIWKACVEKAENASIDDPDYIALFSRASRSGANPKNAINNNALMDKDGSSPRASSDAFRNDFARELMAGELWRQILSRHVQPSMLSAFEALLDRGSLSTRIQSAAGTNPSRSDLHRIYETLCDCLDKNQVFDPKSLKTETANGPNFKNSLAREISDPLSNV